MLAYVVTQQDYPPDIAKLAPEGLRERVLSGINGWEPALCMLVRDGDVSTVPPVV